ncbi:histidinol-phosphatase [Campylobacter porcelli]|uniref:Histidinol-phosphatase n=1 Tax=Campylobacter porcelli TaxID=1660073 RepID=A0A1X9SWR5_9BACT|nr:histidinol-phosphatase [Campylobacter sp. RM6137]ARR00702.1 histidinol-phosphate phosphatase [Campylobacter sp. RM6137]
MIVDLHNHTPLCNHATGTPIEYAKAAFNQGCKYYGFSDHAPMNFDQKYRMSFKDMDDYKESIEMVKAEFKGKMEILFGYEVDYLPGFIDERVMGAKVDYLIGSVHFLNGWGFDNPEFIGEYKNRDIDQIYIDYFNAIKDMARYGKFDIVGHIDLIKVFNYKPKKDIRIIASDALKEIKKSGMSIELNSAGLRKPVGEIYPGDEILEMMSQMGIDITLSSDAHCVEHVGLNMDKTIEKAKKFGYNEVAIYQNREKKMVKI